MSAVLLRPVDTSVKPSRRPDLRLVTPAPSPRRYLVIGLLLVALGVFGVVTLHALATESAFRARALNEDVSEMSLRAEELRAEVAALESPQHIRQVATEQLGMVPATAPGYLVAGAGVPGGPIALSEEDDKG